MIRNINTRYIFIKQITIYKIFPVSYLYFCKMVCDASAQSFKKGFFSCPQEKEPFPGTGIVLKYEFPFPGTEINPDYRIEIKTSVYSFKINAYTAGIRYSDSKCLTCMSKVKEKPVFPDTGLVIFSIGKTDIQRTGVKSFR